MIDDDATRAAALEREKLVRALTRTSDNSVKWTRYLLASLFLLGIALICFVPIASGVAAQGLLAPTKPRQIVQHPTGGVIKTILVRDGQTVEAGQVLVKLEDTQERAAAGVLGIQVVSLRAELAVRQAEVQGLSAVTFPEDLVERSKREPDVRSLLQSQLAAFDARRRSNSNQAEQIRQQIAKNSRQSQQAQARATSARKQLSLIQQERGFMQTLLDKGLTPRTRVLALQRAEANLNGEAGSLTAEIERLRSENIELSKRLEQPGLAARVQASEAMRTIMADLVAAQDRFSAARLALERTVIRAPMAGKIIQNKASTIEGVVRASEPIMEIVPAGDELQLKAKIRLVDADNVSEGMKAVIRFDMMQGTTAPQIHGIVRTISADAIEDPRSGETFFEAKISIAPDEARRLPPQTFAPGRPAEVLIETGSRTLLSYFLLPLDRARFKALREE
jgi:HlyD family type I secretion membrane fusion protein